MRKIILLILLFLNVVGFSQRSIPAGGSAGDVLQIKSDGKNLQFTGTPTLTAVTTGTLSITSQATAPNQSLNDSTTKIANTAYVDRAVSNIPQGSLQRYYFQDAASDIGGYKVMQTTYTATSEAYVTDNAPVSGNIIQSWATPSGYPYLTFIPAGIWQVHIHGYKTGGTKTVQLYAEVYKRAAGGTETLLGTTGLSQVLGASEVDIPAVNFTLGVTTVLVTDRIVVKIRESITGGGSNPTSITIGYANQTSAGLEFPNNAANISNFVPYSGATGNVDLNNKSMINTYSIQTNADCSINGLVVGVGSSTTTVYNTALGVNALAANKNGTNDVGIGYYALNSNTTGGQNTAVGYGAGLSNTTGSDNTDIGYEAGANRTTGGLNTNVGEFAGTGQTTSSSNTCIGYSAGKYLTTGSRNTLLGAYTGKQGANNTGYGNIFIGYGAGYNETTNKKLYITDTIDNSPLIYGDFATDAITINGSLNATGSVTTTLNFIGVNANLTGNVTVTNDVQVGRAVNEYMAILNGNLTDTLNLYAGNSYSIAPTSPDTIKHIRTTVSPQVGISRTLYFPSSGTKLFNSTYFVLPNATNYTVSAGDALQFLLTNTTSPQTWRCVGGIKADGTPFTIPSTLTTTAVTTTSLTATYADITPRVQNAATATITPTNANDYVYEASLSAAVTIANPSGSYHNGQSFVIEIKDNGSSRAITWGGNYVAMAAALPSSTTAGKTLTVVCLYSAIDSKFHTWTAVEQ